MHRAILGATSFRINQRTIPGLNEIACVLQRGLYSRHFLRQWIRVEDTSRQCVWNAGLQGMGLEPRAEVVLAHCGSKELAPLRRKCSDDRDRVEMTGVIRCEDH